jgi:hypothetical protein
MLFCTGVSCGVQAQNELALNDLAFPVVPGERELRFSVSLDGVQANNVEVWVFYAKTAGELTNISASSFGSSKHYGRAIMLKLGTSVDCHFVFPHEFHPASPNGHLFFMYHTKQSANLVSAPGFPIPARDVFGLPVPGNAKIDFNPMVISKDECVYYRVIKRVKSGNSFTDIVSKVLKFRMPDSFNIGIAGDSYGAGEGAPFDEFEPAGNNNDMWLSCKCHRSKNSGHLKGVKKFIYEFPEIAVDYSFQACSGAKTEDLFRVNQLTNDYLPGAALYTNNCGNVEAPKQFQKIRDYLITQKKHDEVNMLLMSIGGNNSGFGDVVIKYLLLPLNLAAINAAGNFLDIDVMQDYAAEIADLRNDYSDLDQGINEFFPEVKPIVALTNYPDPTAGPDGRCGCKIVPCALHENDCISSPEAEYELIRNRFLLPLNAKISTESERLNWNLIDISRTAGDHGLCNCDDPYFNTISASYEKLGDIYGVVHPNRKGYNKMYRDRVFNFISEKYKEYRAGYQLAILFGIKQAPPECTGATTIRLGVILTALRQLQQMSPVITKMKGFEGIPAIVTGKELSGIIEKDDDVALEKNPGFISLRNGSNYKASFNTLPVKKSIVKTSLPKSALNPLRSLRPGIVKIKNEVLSYSKSPEFKQKLATIRKHKSKPLQEEPDPLADLFNNKEN